MTLDTQEEITLDIAASPLLVPTGRIKWLSTFLIGADLFRYMASRLTRSSELKSSVSADEGILSKLGRSASQFSWKLDASLDLRLGAGQRMAFCGRITQ